MCGTSVPSQGAASHSRHALPWAMPPALLAFLLLRGCSSSAASFLSISSPACPLMVALCPQGTLSWLFSPTSRAPMTTPTISGPNSQFTPTYKASSCGLCISKSKPGPLPTPAPLSVLYPSHLYSDRQPGHLCSATPLCTLPLGKLSPLDAFPWPCQSSALCTGFPGLAHARGALTDTSLLCSRCFGLASTRAASSA